MSGQGIIGGGGGGTTQVNYGLFTDYGIINSDNTAIFQNVISGVTSIIPTATDISILVSWQWNCEKTTDNIEVELLFDGVSVPATLGLMQVEEPTDNTGDFMATGSGQQLPRTRMYTMTTGASGTHTIDINFRSDSLGDDCSIWDILARVDGV